MARRSLAGARVLVTGASSGIGRALAIALARRGAKLLLTARRADRLEALTAEILRSGGDAAALPGDVTDRATRDHWAAAIQSRWQGLDILVNNAGVGAYGRFDAASEDRLRQVMEVNFFAPVELTRLLLPLLKQGQRPLVVNVGSVLGHFSVPLKSEYCASKFALHGFSDALRCELRRDNVDVLLVSPSTTASEFFDSVVASQSKQPKAAAGAMSPEVVAQKMVRALERGSQEIILSAGGNFLVWLDRLCPSLANWLMAKFGQK